MNANNKDKAAEGDRLTVVLPANLVAQIDAQVGGGFVDREEFIRAAVRHYIEYLRETQRVADVDVR